MESKKSRKSASRRASTAAAPKKRFRIEKLEERIAPKSKGGGAVTSSGMGYSYAGIY